MFKVMYGFKSAIRLILLNDILLHAVQNAIEQSVCSIEYTLFAVQIRIVYIVYYAVQHEVHQGRHHRFAVLIEQKLLEMIVAEV